MVQLGYIPHSWSRSRAYAPFSQRTLTLLLCPCSHIVFYKCNTWSWRPMVKFRSGIRLMYTESFWLNWSQRDPCTAPINIEMLGRYWLLVSLCPASYWHHAGIVYSHRPSRHSYKLALGQNRAVISFPEWWHTTICPMLGWYQADR